MANTPQTYTVQFRSLQPEKLAEIIVGEQDYHPDAVNAARLELTARMLPMEELDRLYDLAERKRAKNDREGFSTKIGKNKRALSITKSFEKQKLSAIWGRTTILKVIGGYLFINLCFGLYQGISSYLNTRGFGLNGLEFMFLLIGSGTILLILGAGVKGSKLAWWGSLVLFSLTLINAISNAYNTYSLYVNFDGDTGGMGLGALIGRFADDPITAGFKLLIPILLLYLLLRKDTRVACGISKVEDTNMDELDHLI